MWRTTCAKGQIDARFHRLDEMDAMAARLEDTLRGCLQGALSPNRAALYHLARGRFKPHLADCRHRRPSYAPAPATPVFFVGFGHFRTGAPRHRKFP